MPCNPEPKKPSAEAAEAQRIRLEELERRETLLNRVRQALLARSTPQLRVRAGELEKLLEQVFVQTTFCKEKTSECDLEEKRCRACGATVCGRHFLYRGQPVLDPNNNFGTCPDCDYRAYRNTIGGM